MIKKYILYIISFLLITPLLLISSISFANDFTDQWVLESANNSSYDNSYARFSIGKVDILRGDFNPIELNSEYQWRNRYFLNYFTPFIGGMIDSDHAKYIYGGVRTHLRYHDDYIVAISFAPGLYDSGKRKDLGHAIEFRSGIEIIKKLENNTEIGLVLYHLSNAAISNKNPGLETITLTYTVPFDYQSLDNVMYRIQESFESYINNYLKVM